jgi:predicted metal-dependent HD superfamily phosphohydrolase
MEALDAVDRRLSFACPGALLARLAARYAEPHRRYHTWTHVVACFDARDQLIQVAVPEIDLALLFHDAVYEPLSSGNEERSAALLLEEGRREWMDERVLSRAAGLVGATRHAGGGLDTEEACIVVDADLSILAADRAAFDAYERQIRQEYARVDDDAYAAGRSAVLRGFLARPNIYATHLGQRLWEGRARRNLEETLARLQVSRPSGLAGTTDPSVVR